MDYSLPTSLTRHASLHTTYFPVTALVFRCGKRLRGESEGFQNAWLDIIAYAKVVAAPSGHSFSKDGRGLKTSKVLCSKISSRCALKSSKLIERNETVVLDMQTSHTHRSGDRPTCRNADPGPGHGWSTPQVRSCLAHHRL